jgi:hypothetical protein
LRFHDIAIPSSIEICKAILACNPTPVNTRASAPLHRRLLLLALVAWRTASVIARHRRRRAAMTGDVQQNGLHESSLGGMVEFR